MAGSGFWHNVWRAREHLYAIYGTMFPGSLTSIGVFLPHMAQGLLEAKLDLPLVYKMKCALDGLSTTLNSNADAITYFAKRALDSRGDVWPETVYSRRRMAREASAASAFSIVGKKKNGSDSERIN